MHDAPRFASDLVSYDPVRLAHARKLRNAKDMYISIFTVGLCMTAGLLFHDFGLQNASAQSIIVFGVQAVGATVGILACTFAGLVLYMLRHRGLSFLQSGTASVLQRDTVLARFSLQSAWLMHLAVAILQLAIGDTNGAIGHCALLTTACILPRLVLKWGYTYLLWGTWNGLHLASY